jgi:hypothetical protein
MLCAEHNSLQQQDRAAVQNFRASIRDLLVLVDDSATDSDFDLAHRRIRTTRRACEVAHDALEHHQEEHGCLEFNVAARISVGAPHNEERRLLAEYETVTGFYSWTVREVSRQPVTLSSDEYGRLRNMVENARLECEMARLALQNFRERNSK